MARRCLEATEQDAMVEALNALIDARDPVRRGRLMQGVLHTWGQKDHANLGDLVDLIMSIDDPIRSLTKADVVQYLQKHPGFWNQARDDALREAIERDQASGRFPRNPFGSWK